MARGKRPTGGGAVSAVVEDRDVEARDVRAPELEATARPEELAALVVELVRLAGGRLASADFEPVALLLVRAGVLDGDGLTFGSDYDLNIRSRELRRGYVLAVDSGKLLTNSREMWLGHDDVDLRQTDSEAVVFAREVFGLPREELVRQARRLLLAE
jgi:hypothetical protein